MSSRSKLWIRIILKSTGTALVGVIVAGIIYEQVGRWQDRKRLPQIGRSVDIGGRTLNIYCSGEGGPPVILESPGAGPGYGWAHLQPEVAKFTETCWYDRAGVGWSDPGPFPRTSAAIAKDLHELLQRGGIAAPYVLVGSSFGGLNVRVYNGLYPNEVAGMVLVDSAHEDEPKLAPKFALGHTAPRYLWYPLHLMFQTAANIGLLRVTQPSQTNGQNPSEQSSDQIVAALCRQPKSVANDASTGVVMPESLAQARAAAGLGDRPLIVLTAGKAPSFGDPEMDRQAAAYQQVWIHQMQAQLAQLSTRGRQIVVKGSDHGNIEQDVVISAIREVVSEIREERSGR